MDKPRSLLNVLSMALAIENAYFKTLEHKEEKERYSKKIEDVGFDPHALQDNEWSTFSPESWPNTTYIDVVNYAVYTVFTPQKK